MRSLILPLLLSMLFLLSVSEGSRRRGGLSEHQFQRLVTAVANEIQASDRLQPLIFALKANTVTMGRLLEQAAARNVSKRLDNVERRLRKTVTMSQQRTWSLKVVRMLGPALKRLAMGTQRLEAAVNELRNRTGLKPLPAFNQTITKNTTAKCFTVMRSDCVYVLEDRRSLARSARACKSMYNGTLLRVRNKEEEMEVRKQLMTSKSWRNLTAWVFPRITDSWRGNQRRSCLVLMATGKISKKPCWAKMKALCVAGAQKKKKSSRK